MKESLLYKKIYGCLAGGAVGDAFGAPFEGKHYKDIERDYGKVTDFDEKIHTYKGFPNIKCGVTDDTRMEHLLIKAILKKRGVPTSDDWAKTWLEHPIDPNDFWIDIRASYIRLQEGVVPRLAWMGNVESGEGFMYTQPLGFFFIGNPEEAVIHGRDLTWLTEGPPLDDCGGITAAVIAEAMRPDATVESVIEKTISIAKGMPRFPSRGMFSKETIGGFIENAVNIAREYDDVFEVREALYDKALSYHSNDAIEVEALALAMMRVAKGDVKKAIIGGANIGRDADTIARLAGSFCGALKGIDAVPKDMLEKVEKANIGVVHYMDKPLNEVAKELTEVVREHLERTENNINQVKRML